MPLDATWSDSPEQAELRHDLVMPLTAISAQTQLLQRRVLRANDLSTLERELMLDTITSTMASIH